ncbi:MAG: NUDIX hydrolase N-terminal domain-containing protein [Anaerolineaceae bacterium]|jgi:ADP-ribose pyrophosphatase YjhB (NUDIX family)
METTDRTWLEWAQRLQAVAQSGLAYCSNVYDIERYHQISNIAAEIVAHYGDADLSVVHGLFASQSGYATPKIDCRGVIFQDEKLLLVRELADGGWTLPGGWVDVGEPLSKAVEREVREESGYLIKASRLLAVYDRNLHGHPPYLFHSYKLFVQCEVIGKTEADPTETAEPTFYAEGDFPPLSLLRTTPEEISRMFTFLRQPDKPAEFD